MFDKTGETRERPPVAEDSQIKITTVRSRKVHNERYCMACCWVGRGPKQKGRRLEVVKKGTEPGNNGWGIKNTNIEVINGVV